jgi:murein DD-endopeptidase MepM/ murein hydrolase activator NlpD
MLEASEERKALDAARNEIIKQQREEYNNGGNLEGEILSSGTEGKYFAPFAGNVSAPNNSSTTGGCSNTTPVYHDIYASIGTPVYAPYDGTAKYIQSNCNGVLYSFGNQVRVYKEDGTYITYAHFSKFPDGITMPITQDCTNKSSSGSQCGAGHCTVGMTSTKVAEVTVKKGQLIGYTGTTGNSLGPHLHVEIHEQGSSACVTDPWAAFGMR